MDDRIDAPQDPSRYTLEIGADGRATMRADCNRGTGLWASASAGALRFGPVAATKALCPPDSLSQKYLARFQWVRSCVREDGRLYLATMADGSTMEFEPMEPPLAATVLGEEVRTRDAAGMQEGVLTRLLDRYAMRSSGVSRSPTQRSTPMSRTCGAACAPRG